MSFPIRKSPRSFSFSEGIVKKVAATLTKATEELKNSSSRSPISPRLSIISSFSLFSFEEAKPAVLYATLTIHGLSFAARLRMTLLSFDEEDSIESVVIATPNFGKF